MAKLRNDWFCAGCKKLHHRHRWRDGSAIGVLEANDRLIAAAPEMLATLKWLCEQMQAEQDAGVSGFDDWMSPARAIIVKAEQA